MWFAVAPYTKSTGKEDTIGKINWTRVLLGGLLPGVIISTTTCTAPSVFEVVVRNARVFTLASPRTLVTWASVSERFSTDTENCFAFGMEVPFGRELPKVLPGNVQERQ